MPDNSNQIVAAESTQSWLQPGRLRQQVRAEFESRLSESAELTIRLQYAEFLFQTGETHAAVSQYEQVLRSIESANTPQLGAIVYNQLACVHRQRGDYALAAALQRRSLAVEIHDSIDADLAADLGNLAADAIAAGDLSLAENLLRRSLALELAADSPAGQAADYGNLAIVHGLRGDYRSAIHCLRLALKLHRRLNDVRAVGCDLMNLAAMYEMQQRWTRSACLLELAVRLFYVGDAAELVAQARTALATVRRVSRLGAFDAARN